MCTHTQSAKDVTFHQPHPLNSTSSVKANTEPLSQRVLVLCPAGVVKSAAMSTFGWLYPKDGNFTSMTASMLKKCCS